MLIISKFRDYYDASVGYGVDKTIIYERETRVVKSKEFFLDDYIAGENYYRGFDWVRGSKIALHEWKIIGFCGKTYVLLIEKTKETAGDPAFETIEYFYGDEILERVFRNKKDKWRYKETRDFINKWHNKEFFDFFLTNKAPIFSVQPLGRYLKTDLEVQLNHSLEEFKFFRIFDSFSAFQEIQMFISGVLGISSPKTLEIDNKERIKQAGFDLKWSFRNPDPPKRKQK